MVVTGRGGRVDSSPEPPSNAHSWPCHSDTRMDDLNICYASGLGATLHAVTVAPPETGPADSALLGAFFSHSSERVPILAGRRRRREGSASCRTRTIARAESLAWDREQRLGRPSHRENGSWKERLGAIPSGRVGVL